MKKMKLSFFIFVFLITTGNAQEIVIGRGQGDSPPYYFMENNKLVGICPDIITEAAQALGIQVVFKDYPWKRMMYFAENGEIDGVMPVYKTEEREKFLYFVPTSLALDPFAFFVDNESSIKQYSGTLQQFKDLSIGVISGYSYGKEFDEAIYLKRDYAKNEEKLMKKFRGKRFKVGLGNPYVLGYFADKLGMQNKIVFLKPLYSKEPLYLAFSRAKGHQKLAEQLDTAIKNLKKTKAYKKIFYKYKVVSLDID